MSRIETKQLPDEGNAVRVVDETTGEIRYKTDGSMASIERSVVEVETDDGRRYRFVSETLVWKDGSSRRHESFPIRGGRTGQKIHYGTSGSSMIACGHRVNALLGRFRISFESFATLPESRLCEKCFFRQNVVATEGR